MHLGKLYDNFDSRCQSYTARINHIISMRSSIDNWKYNYLTEVLVSDIWQSWCNFCRNLLFSSCRGAYARDGSIIAKRGGDNSWERLGYEASQGIRNQTLRTNGHVNFAIRKEPTWGDLDKFIKATQALQPSNSNTLLSIFGSFTELKNLQLVRNACAHKNVETITDLLSLSSEYSFSELNCVTELAWQNKKVGGHEFAIELWLYEMNLIADYATETN